MSLGPSEIVLVIVVVMLLFGGKRLPEVAKNIGRGFAEVRRWSSEMKREMNSSLTDTPRRTPSYSSEKSSDVNSSPVEVNVNPAAQPRTPPPTSGQNS